MKNKLLAKDVIEGLDLRVVNTDKADLNREIDQPSISRKGLELAGVFSSDFNKKNVIGWGTKENVWLESLSKTKVDEALARVLNKTTPLVIISKGINDRVFKMIVSFASKLKIPVVQVKEHLSWAIINIGSYIVAGLAPSEHLHGSLVNIHGVGVLIIGPSGIGKSEAVLELIQDEQLFVSDDVVVVTKIGNEFIGRSAPITKGYLEARGIGLIDIQHMYGAKTVKDQSTIDLVVELVEAAKMNELDRLGNRNLRFRVLDGYIPLIKIPVNSGRSISSLIKAATSAHIAKKQGMDPLKEIAKRSS